MKTPVYLVGDIHGVFTPLFHKLDRLEINNCYLICVGDLGVGYTHENKQARILEDLNERFKARDIRFLSVRGNHDSPQYFDGRCNLSHLKLLPDYSYATINDKRWLFVGGAVSVDRTDSVPGFSYWEDELFVFSPEKLTKDKIDVLVTHSGPSWIGPNTKTGIVAHYCKKDLTLWEDCVKERQEHEKLFEAVKPDYWYLGHFHRSQQTNQYNKKTKILDILEIDEADV